MLNRIRSQVSGNAGFTLIEMVAVLVVLAVISSFAIAKMVSMKDQALEAGIQAGVNELNAREALAHAKVLLQDVDAATFDTTVWSYMLDGGSEPDLNPAGSMTPDYVWDAMNQPTQAGGDITFKSSSVYSLVRTPATMNERANWTFTGQVF